MSYRIIDKNDAHAWEGMTFPDREAVRRELITCFWYEFFNENPEMTPDQVNKLPLETILDGAQLELVETQ